MDTATRSFSELSSAQCRLMAWRVAQGVPLTEAAAAGRIDVVVAGRLFEDAGFLDLVAVFRRAAGQARDDRRRRLLLLALQVVDDASPDGEAHVEAFLLAEERRGRQAALAECADEEATAGSAAAAPLSAMRPGRAVVRTIAAFDDKARQVRSRPASFAAMLSNRVHPLPFGASCLKSDLPRDFPKQANAP